MDEKERARVYPDGITIWFTGLPCSGKSTIADSLAERLKQKGVKVQRLDADIIRKHLWKELGYSKEDRDENIRRASYLKHARQEVGSFMEVYVKCPVEVCIQRDTRGLYKKAMAGEISNFTGISDPYEEPTNPEVLIESDKETLEESIAKVMDKLKELKYI